jgi:hypothetical protein
MLKPLYLSVIAILPILFFAEHFCAQPQSKVETPVVSRKSSTPQVLFDDFNYSNSKKMVNHGWIIRAADGWPGMPGAKWLTKSVSFISDTETSGNRILRMTSSTDGTSANTIQTQICHERKYREGTYAARVRFTDQPVSGPAGDQIVQSFYTISPQKAPMDPDYSELDFEYLPNGGWGETGTMIYATSWFTFRLEPWFQDNMSNHVPGSQAGWHTLVTQVADGKVKYFVDGKILAEHGGKFYPRVPMSINFNLWFIKDGTITSRDKREYQEDIDWVFHQSNTVLSPVEIDSAIDSLRRKSIRYKDTVTAPIPALESPCNF